MIEISILMPVKNGSRYIGECLESIQSQSLKSWELIIVDDHSSDDTSGIVRSFTSSDPRISYYSNVGNGIVDALKLAFQQSNGNYITRMDCDDLMTVDRLKLFRKSVRPGRVVTGMVKYIADGRLSPGYKKYENWLNNNLLSDNPYRGIYRECIIASPNWMLSRSDIEKLDLFNQLRYPEDYDMVFYLYKNQFEIIALQDITLLWRDHSGRTSRNSDIYQQNSFFELKLEHFLDIDWNQKPVMIWGKGKKSKLAQSFFDQKNVPYEVSSREDVKESLDFTDNQILLAIYPQKKERLEIESFLSTYHYKIGLNAWYL